MPVTSLNPKGNTMTAILLRLCEKDRAKYPGGDEEGWVRFDEAALDDIPWDTHYEWEMGDLGVSIDFLLRVDWLAKTTRGKAGLMWLARTVAGVKTPPMDKFDIKVRLIEIKPEKASRARKPKDTDAVPPGEAPSSAVGESGTD